VSTATRTSPRHVRKGPPEPVALPATRADAAGNVTRLLCAGVHLDPRFRRQVLDHLLKQRHRFTAPAYGYDCVAVLAHALCARRRRRFRTLAFGGCLLPLIATAFAPPGLVPTLLAVTLWWAWAVLVGERLLSLHLLATRLRRKNFATGPDGRSQATPSVPYHELLSARAKEISAEQCYDGVYYSGYMPFVGAGTPTREWSFSVVLNAVDGGPVRDRDLFQVHQLLDHVGTRLHQVLRQGGRFGIGIGTLGIARRPYRTALTTVKPPPLRRAVRGPDGLPAQDSYDAAREYLCVTLGSWDGELVTSIFVGVDLRGDTMHTELHSYALLPIKESFHEVDRLPERLGWTDVLSAAVTTPLREAGHLARSLTSTLGHLVPEKNSGRRPMIARITSFLLLVATVPPAVFAVLQLLNVNPFDLLPIVGAAIAVWVVLAVAGGVRNTYRRYRESVAETTPREPEPSLAGSEGTKIVDWGARTSIRELAAGEDPHHFFQQVDQDKYTKLIERRVTDFIHEFLRHRHIDLSEFASRQATVLNYGIINTGAGGVVNQGTMAVGTESSATTA
jgi:hypothetical protein